MINELIQGDKFTHVSSCVFSPNIKKKYTDYDKLNNTFSLESLERVNLVYMHTMYVKEFFCIINNLNNKFILISHNSDDNIDRSYSIPTNLLYWFSQNVGIYEDRLESIPIGLENDRWFPEINKKRSICNQLLEAKRTMNLLYINHNYLTYKRERKKPYKLFKNSSWCTLVSGKNGIHYDKYIDNIYNHCFVLCPRGNGLDTHRFWETLYLGSYPVVIRNPNNSFYKDLPVLFVDHWKQITEELLVQKYEEFQSLEWSMEKLKFSYWENRIYDVYQRNDTDA